MGVSKSEHQIATGRMVMPDVELELGIQIQQWKEKGVEVDDILDAFDFYVIQLESQRDLPALFAGQP
jgi:hypothetical protein